MKKLNSIYIVVIGIFALLTTPTTIANTLPGQEKEPKFVVVLDAGHGGHDSGNRGNGYFEKDIALNIILEVGKLLEKDERFKVIYTRKDDSFVELYERGAIANRASADLFVSVHCNAHNSQAFGTETFVLGLHKNATNFEVAKKENAAILLEDDYESNYEGFDPNSAESVIGLTLMQEEYLEQSLSLASLVQKNFTKELKKQDRGVKQAGFIVLHKTFMPSILIETGFLTNNKEGKYLNSKKGQQEIAQAIKRAVLKYKEQNDLLFETKEQEIIQDAIAQQSLQAEETIETVANDLEILVEETAQVSEAVPDPVTTVTATSEEPKPANAITFKVQIAASSTDLDLTADNFKGLTKISKAKIGTLYKYYYDQATTLEAIQERKAEARSAGFPSCFIVSFQNGKRIPLSDALKLAD